MFLVTGSAGFIGYHLSISLLETGRQVIGIDNHNNYYDPNLKELRLKNLQKYDNYSHNRIDIENYSSLEKIFSSNNIKFVINLAAQAGVRYSIEEPKKFIDTNIVGFQNLIDLSTKNNIQHFVYASSSSVYGSNSKMPFSTEHSANHPISVYAMTKTSNELLAHVYSYLYKLPTTGLRYFTVYGPYGRPDMAMFKFTEKILKGETIDIYNDGNHKRDFTFISDIVEATIEIINKPASADPNWSSDYPKSNSSNVPWKIYNIGNNKMIDLKYFIELIETNIGKKAKRNFLPIQAGDVENTYADMSDISKDFNFKPKVSIEEGVKEFVGWYKDFYGSKDK